MPRNSVFHDSGVFDAGSGALTIATSSGYATVQDEGTPLTARLVLDFAGAGVTVTDDAGNSRTLVTIPGGGGGGSGDGWTDASSETWTYASATSFTIAGVDKTAEHQKGTYLRLKQGGAFKYFVVASSTFSTDTTVTLVATSDYSLANSAITDNAYSYQANPQGWPGWFTFASTVTGWAATPVSTIKWNIVGSMSTIAFAVTGTSNSTTTTVTLPVACNDAALYGTPFTAWPIVAIDAGSVTNGRATFSGDGSTTMTFQKLYDGTAFTNTGTKVVRGLLSYRWF